MNEETLKALEGSIIKWDLICMGVETDEESYNCPLCAVFTNDDGDRDDCIKCPVALKSKEEGCTNTPWKEWNNVINSFTHEAIYTPILLRYRYIPWFIKNMNPAKVGRLIDLAWDELEFLITLLPEGHKWRETL